MQIKIGNVLNIFFNTMGHSEISVFEILKVYCISLLYTIHTEQSCHVYALFVLQATL